MKTLSTDDLKIVSGGSEIGVIASASIFCGLYCAGIGSLLDLATNSPWYSATKWFGMFGAVYGAGAGYITQ